MERRGTRPGLVATGVAVGPPGAGPILRDVSLAVSPGEWLGITGANGSGKTTLALALAGLAPIREGRLVLDDEPIFGGARVRVAAILQEPGSQMLSDDVFREIALAAENLGSSQVEAAAAAQRAAGRLGITELERSPSRLSPGRQQMVLLAAALAASPALLVADEACAHLDPAARNLALSVLEEECDQGLALVWITQSAYELGHADRVLEVARGGLEPWGGARQHEAHAATRLQVASGEGIARLRIHPNHHHDTHIRVDREIDLAIPPTGVVMVTGANGSGKTTILECLVGLQDRPEVEVSWYAPPGASTAASYGPLLVGERPETQVVHELVADELVHAAVSRGRRRTEALSEATALLEVLGLDLALLGRRSWSLSSGEKRLVLTVGAMIAPTAMLALDEPTAGLDAVRSEAMANLVQQRATRGPVVVASQDRDWASGVADIQLEIGIVRAG